MKPPFLAAVLALNACAPVCDLPVDSGDRSGSATISGYIYDVYSGERVPSARVAVVGTSRQTVTDSLGQFVFSDLTPDTYTFHISKDNLGTSYSQPLSVGASDSGYFHVGLRPLSGYWDLTIRWDDHGAYKSSLVLLQDGSVKLGHEPFGTWSFVSDSIHIDFSNGTMLDGIVNDSIFGLVDQRDYPIDGAFVGTR